MAIINNNVKCADRGVRGLRGIILLLCGTIAYAMTTVEQLTHMTLGRDAAVRVLLYTQHTHKINYYLSITETP